MLFSNHVTCKGRQSLLHPQKRSFLKKKQKIYQCQVLKLVYLGQISTLYAHSCFKVIANKPSCHSWSCFNSLWPRSITNSIALGETQSAVLTKASALLPAPWVRVLECSPFLQFLMFLHESFCIRSAKDCTYYFYFFPSSLSCILPTNTVRFQGNLHSALTDSQTHFPFFKATKQKHLFNWLIFYWFDSKLF